MKPIAVSMGDPAGIGLELAARVWAEPQDEPPWALVGDAHAFARACGRLALDPANVRIVDHAADLCAGGLLHMPLAIPETPGAPDPANAPAQIAAIESAVNAVREGAASALVTLPIAKSVLQAAGFGFPGHTEFLADLTKNDACAGERGPIMMLAGPSLRIALATIHTPLAHVPAAITPARIAHVVRVTGDALKRDFGVENPRIAICGLNPHAGESGHIGREEIDVINPAAARLRGEGWDVTDARAADALFHGEARKSYDAAIALYHDQGLLPIKTLHFWEAVNVTLGLPIVRTSPDHGAGFDIAGKGVARADSFRAALRLAWDMAQRRARA